MISFGPQTCGSVLDRIKAHIRDWVLGGISETADGAAPHAATGAHSRHGRPQTYCVFAGKR